ncbi:MAG: hypothetical protein K0R61_4938 [Microvirga sp.]|jgi:hypothetical protein|nr:hypothetical protein [Microvirga sp.]
MVAYQDAVKRLKIGGIDIGTNIFLTEYSP